MPSRGGSGSFKYSDSLGRRTTSTRRTGRGTQSGSFLRIKNYGRETQSLKNRETPSVVKSDLYYDYMSNGKKVVKMLPVDKIEFNKSKYSKIKKAISENVKQLRKDKKMNCEDLANISNITRQYIGQIEKGEKNITLEKLCDLATALEVDVDFLINEYAFDIKERYIQSALSAIRKLPKRKQIDFCINIIKELTGGDETNETL